MPKGDTRARAEEAAGGKAAGAAGAVDGWLLSVTYEDVERRTWFRLWVKHDDGSVRSYLDPAFEPYFWLLPADGVDARALADAAKGLTTGDGRKLSPVDARVEERVWGRERRKVVRVVLQHPGHTPPLRAEARHLQGVDEVLEADVPFAHRYLMDKRLRPFGRVRFRVDPDAGWEGEPVAVDPEPADADGDAPPVKVLAIDIETPAPTTAPQAERDRVAIVSFASSQRDEPWALVLGEDAPDEEGLLDAVVRTINTEDPDVVVTFNGDNFDWPYLEARSGKTGVRLGVGRVPDKRVDDGAVGTDAGSAPRGLRRPEVGIRQAGGSKVVEIEGRVSVDLYRVAARDLPEVKMKTLSNVAEALGVPAREEEADVAGEAIHAYWMDPELRPRLIEYAREDARETLGIARALLPLQMEFARLLRHPLDDVSRMGRGRMVDAFLMAESVEEVRLAPNKGGQAAEEYEGGFVLEPEPGLHEDVVALDFGAMYPTLMMAYNVSPETFVGTFDAETARATGGSGEGDGRGGDGAGSAAARGARGAVAGVGGGESGARAREGASAGEAVVDVPVDGGSRRAEVWIAPEVGHAFLKAPPGFFPRILRRLVDERRAIKARMKGVEAGVERDLLDVRQQSLKVLTNAFYGYMGWAQARWLSFEAAEATTAWGRHVIRSVRERAESKGIAVLYGDTDSLFVTDNPRVPEFVKEVNRDLPLELDVQAHYSVIFFTGMKKRYAGLTREGDVVVRGLEVRRGDWCPLAKRVQAEVLDTVLRERDPAAAARRVIEVVHDLREGRVPREDLTIHKTLTQRPHEYKVRPAHVTAVERAMREHPDYKPVVGVKVGFVVLKPAKKNEPLSERTKLVQHLEPGEGIDTDYYVDKQVVPAAHRILEHFGHSEDELKGAPKQKSLFEF